MKTWRKRVIYLIRLNAKIYLKVQEYWTNLERDKKVQDSNRNKVFLNHNDNNTLIKTIYNTNNEPKIIIRHRSINTTPQFTEQHININKILNAL